MQYHVYALIDPRTERVVYIGYTHDVHHRFQQQINCTGANRNKNMWVTQLVSQNLLPSFKILESLDDHALAKFRESYWISYYVKDGSRLFNIQENSEKGFYVGVLKQDPYAKQKADYTKKMMRFKKKFEAKGREWVSVDVDNLRWGDKEDEG